MVSATPGVVRRVDTLDFPAKRAEALLSDSAGSLWRRCLAGTPEHERLRHLVP
jgi:hypothetical protein